MEREDQNEIGRDAADSQRMRPRSARHTRGGAFRRGQIGCVSGIEFQMPICHLLIAAREQTLLALLAFQWCLVFNKLVNKNITYYIFSKLTFLYINQNNAAKNINSCRATEITQKINLKIATRHAGTTGMTYTMKKLKIS